MTVYSQSLPVREPWLLTTKYLLMQKAAVCYYDLGKSQQQDKQYIAALANLNMAYTCLGIASNIFIVLLHFLLNFELFTCECTNLLAFRPI